MKKLNCKKLKKKKIKNPENPNKPHTLVCGTHRVFWMQENSFLMRNFLHRKCNAFSCDPKSKALMLQPHSKECDFRFMDIKNIREGRGALISRLYRMFLFVGNIFLVLL